MAVGMGVGALRTAWWVRRHASLAGSRAFVTWLLERGYGVPLLVGGDRDDRDEATVRGDLEHVEAHRTAPPQDRPGSARRR